MAAVPIPFFFKRRSWRATSEPFSALAGNILPFRSPALSFRGDGSSIVLRLCPSPPLPSAFAAYCGSQYSLPVAAAAAACCKPTSWCGQQWRLVVPEAFVVGQTINAEWGVDLLVVE